MFLRKLAGSPHRWRILMDGNYAAPADEVLRIGQNCPSGATRVHRRDDTASSHAAPKVNTIRVRENCPLAIEARS